MQLKRILAIFLAAALIFSAFTVSVGAEPLKVFEVGVAAETTTPVSSSPVIYNANEEVTVTISADQNTGFDLLKFKVIYDPEALEFVNYTTNHLFGKDTLEAINPQNGYVLFTAILNSVSTVTGDMFTLKFKTKADFCGEVEIVTQLSDNKENNCMITNPNAKTVVPFVGGSDSFELHNMDAAAGVVTAPTCTEEGYTTYSCANCDVVIGNYVAANGHTEAEAVEENRVEADCTNNGSYDKVVYCSVCDEELSRENFTIDALGHKHLEAVEENHVDADCTNNGSYDKVVYCSVCDEELSRENFTIDALGHKHLEAVEENRVEADCTNNGSYDMVVYCELCDAELSREGFVIDAHGHSPLDAVEENYVAPDCINKGSYDMVVYCDICDAELSRETFIIDALGHDTIPHDSKAPTCTEIGWETYNTCSRCDYTTYVELAALGHDLVAHEAKAPTCTEIGWDAYDSCSRCDYTTYVELSALGHNCEAVWYKDNNEHWHICSVCDDRADVAGHIYNGDHICDECDFGNVNIAEIFPDTQNDAWYSDAVAYAYSRGILMGYQSGEFGVSDGIQRQNFLLMLARYDGVDLTQYSYDCDMSDVTRGSYYEAAVNWGVQNGITTGYTNGTFGVGDKITREQIVTFLYRYAKYKNIDVENVTDTKAKNYPDFNMVSDFSKEAIVWAIDKGVIGGKQGYIAPQGNAQRCEVAQIMYNIFLKDIF